MVSKKKWDDDQLNRSIEADFLYNYLVKRYRSEKKNKFKSLVLNIDASWGLGKTFFLEHWAKDLQNSNHPVVFFNAWNSDFQNDPLVAFMSEIESQLKPFFNRSRKAQEKLKIAFKSGVRLLKNSMPLISAILLKQLSGLNADVIKNILNGEEEFDINSLYSDTNDLEDENEQNTPGREKLTKSLISLFSLYGKESLEKYLSQKKDIQSFRKNFSNLISHIEKLKSNRLPIFIIIDELDRCRPTYSIELLEQIKHLFSIKGVYFILATDTKQLCHSIKSVYGNDFDSSIYLNRFFDQSYEFQEPDYEIFAYHLFNQHNISNFPILFSFYGDQMITKTGNPNIEIFATLAKYFKFTLRDQEQMMNHFYTICLTWPDPQEKLHTILLLFLLMLKHASKDEFEKLEASNCSLSTCIQKSSTFYESLNTSVAFKEKGQRTSQTRFNEVRADQSNLSVPEIIELYQNLIQKTRLQLEAYHNKKGTFFKDNLRNFLIQEFNSRLNRLPEQQRDVLNLKHYFEIVKQTGNLIKDKDFQIEK